MSMSNRLRELRARYGVMQGELARAIGVTRQTIIAVENGKYLPSLRLAFKLAKAFNARIEDAFNDHDDS